MYFKVSSCHNTENRDYVQIFDGNSEKSANVLELCGYRNDGISVTSTGNILFVTFHFWKRDYANVGFEMKITVVKGDLHALKLRLQPYRLEVYSLIDQITYYLHAF